jgi:anti-sigma28 factor (negative regulator of flagellin synthesis)
MKITGPNPVRNVDPVAPSGRKERASAPSGSPDNVQISTDAKFLREVRDAAAQMPSVRGEEVERAQADIADGALEANTDLERVVDALMVEP